MEVIEILAECLDCGEQWRYALPGLLMAFMSLVSRRRPAIDRCPKCGQQVAVLKRLDHCRGGGSTS